MRKEVRDANGYYAHLRLPLFSENAMFVVLRQSFLVPELWPKSRHSRMECGNGLSKLYFNTSSSTDGFMTRLSAARRMLVCKVCVSLQHTWYFFLQALLCQSQKLPNVSTKGFTWLTLVADVAGLEIDREVMIHAWMEGGKIKSPERGECRHWAHLRLPLLGRRTQVHWQRGKH